MKKKQNISCAAGRRKTAVARAFLRKGDGKIAINGKTVEEYFPVDLQQDAVRAPLKACEIEGVDLVINVRGGGKEGQAIAVRHAISRTLVKEDEERRRVLKDKGYLTRDPRKKERKKYGKPGARKSFQFSKR